MSGYKLFFLIFFLVFGTKEVFGINLSKELKYIDKWGLSDKKEIDSFCVHIRELVENVPEKTYKGIILLQAGLRLIDVGQEYQAFEMLSECKKNTNLGAQLKSNERIDLELSLSNIYAHFGRLELAIQGYKRVCKLPDVPKHVRINCMNGIGISYYKLGKYELAERFFKRGADLAVKYNKESLNAVCVGNLGAVHFKMKLYDLAEKEFIYDIEVSEKEGDWNSVIFTSKSLSQLYIKLKRKDKLNTLFRLFERIPNKERYLNMPEFCELQAMFYNEHADQIHSVQMYQRAIWLKDSINNVFQADRIKDFEFQLKLEKKEMELKRRTFEKKSMLIQYILVVVLIVVISILVIKTLVSRIKDGRIKYEHELKIKDLKLNHYVDKMNTTLDLLDEKLIVINELKSQLETLETNNANISHHDMVKLKGDLDNFSLVREDDLNRFEELFSEVFPTFFKNLKTTYPAITRGELRYAALIKLDYNRNKLTHILGVSEHAVRKTDLRLRKKMGIEGTSTDLRNFLITI